MASPSFAAALDEALRRAAQEPTRTAFAAASSPCAPPAVPPFLFARPLTPPAPRWVTMASRPPRRPAHRLSDEQQRAFDQLATLGAELPAGFSAEELQREYRRLARRYHPDGHARCGAAERRQLARNFADAAEGYRCLRAVVEPRH